MLCLVDRLLWQLDTNSNATINAFIVKSGVTLYTTTRLSGSAVAFGACDRLEKYLLRKEGIFSSD